MKLLLRILKLFLRGPKAIWYWCRVYFYLRCAGMTSEQSVEEIRAIIEEQKTKRRWKEAESLADLRARAHKEWQPEEVVDFESKAGQPGTRRKS